MRRGSERFAFYTVVFVCLIILGLTAGYLLHEAAATSGPSCTYSGVETVPGGAISAARCNGPLP